MKIKKFLLAGGLALAVLVTACDAGAAGNETQQMFEQGRAALTRGDRATAHRLFGEVLKRDPRHTTARFYYEKSKPKEGAAVNEAQAMMSRLVVDKVEFNEAPLGDVIEFIGQKAHTLSGGKFRPNIVYTGPTEDLKEKKVTFRLSNVPLSIVLQYAGQLTKTNFKYGEHAIEGRPEIEVAAELKIRADAEAAAAAAAKERERERERAAASQAFDPFSKDQKEDSLEYLR